MKALVIYDSVFGNTEKVARSIADALGAAAVRVSAVQAQELAGVELLVVGSPTRQFTATPGTLAWLNALAGDALKGVHAAAFDTRLDVKSMNFIARLIVDKGGYAVKPIEALLKAKGATVTAAPGAFLVKESEGPLKDGEMERAAAWARQLLTEKA